MKVIYEYREINTKYKRGIALGNFDGVHIGHQKLIKSLLDKSKSQNLESCIYTFINHTVPVIYNRNELQFITNIDTKKNIFKSFGIDLVFLDKFNEKLMHIDPKDFVKKILVKTFNCKEVIVGFDYRFGYKAEGDVFLLKKLGKLYGFEVTVIDAVTIGGEKVSSSNIRKYLLNGDIEKANIFLGRYFSLHNKVIHGDKIGTKLGYPTANINIDPLQIIPKSGVYATLIKIDKKTYMGATFIGTKPTFQSSSTSIETFIIDYDGDIYGKFIDIYFVKRIRDEIRFTSPKELVFQINRDIQEIKNCLQSSLNVLK